MKITLEQLENLEAALWEDCQRLNHAIESVDPSHEEDQPLQLTEELGRMIKDYLRFLELEEQ
jgi:hypothetical protein